MNNYSHSEQTLPSEIIYMVLNNGTKVAAKEDAVLTFIENNYDYYDELDNVEVYEWCKAKLDAEVQAEPSVLPSPRTSLQRTICL